jgi:DNA repair photolyase
VLISKNFTDQFTKNVLANTKPLVLHCTCTGYGGTKLEPNVPDYKTQLNNLKNIINMGFPAERCVLRIDPVFPSEEGLKRVGEELDYFISLNTGITRIRISIVDEYPHVRERYKQYGWKPLYNGNFGPSKAQIELVAKTLNKYPFAYEVCAEDYLSQCLLNCKVNGCISNTDLELMGIPVIDMPINPQNRKGCHCLSCKTELLTEKKPCPHQCVYCFWK